VHVGLFFRLKTHFTKRGAWAALALPPFGGWSEMKKLHGDQAAGEFECDSDGFEEVVHTVSSSI
jgi:hypothetical protein